MLASRSVMPQRFGGAMRLRRRRFDRAAGPLGRLGTLEVRLARSGEELKQAQKLRYRVFYEEMSAVANVRALFSGRDRDPHDRSCDHLLVLDHAGGDQPQIVGTYRLLRQEIAEKRKGFYSASEFNVDDLVARHGNRSFLELSRSCVLKPYRTKRTVELLWHGIWTYIRQHNIDVIFGCASLQGTEIKALAPRLALLNEAAPAPEAWRVRALPGRGLRLDQFAADPEVKRHALKDLPPLVKGYLRLGAYVCEEAVIDWQFGTTDVFMLQPVETFNARYVNYYGAEATRHAA